MKWSEVCVHTTTEAVEPVSNILHESGASGVVIEDPADMQRRKTKLGEIYELNPADYPAEGVYVKAYMPMNSFLMETVDGVKKTISNLTEFGIDIGRNEITVQEIHEEDWATAWKKYYKPVKISEKITIIPEWEDYTPVSSDEIIIEMDPGMAFGTGTHPTTVLSIQALEQYLEKGDVVADVGAGSGILSVASVLLGAEHAYAYDLDDVAVSSTKNNAALNGVENQVTSEVNDLLEGVDWEADLIVSNILAEIIVKFTDDAFRVVKPGGYFITCGIISARKEMVRDRLIESGFEIVETNKMEDWISIIAKKPE
ncbi:50S ribosomal protein L11 methyltransferase [Halobacillus litoralis]|uniref:Ribosomal protein L11 methyltransferase n=1 Tax=Halobacillus litoralis TaxID=45668 RepID=A0A845DTH2_9BACI|nr:MULTISPECIES: 50S ribosomal protein L11 methyltransferase [Halobacillus]MCA1021435.1 50S ribosomal protein L11 methyltransferase [Halobacillus litoralis]MYL19825.1 50S ribosomal protein L11 methyltransferase [Halobacillus litoralis]MYL28971.1 50S ribosomal protein L11 methyltransferase [Halobacillus halophilus]MYL37222.1 50S ribosomal protein L11 methyltransferase [Halobacillus litoralis]